MEHIIEASNISFAFPGKHRNILNGCSLTVDKNEIISILGPNGAGKSTLLNCLCGLLKPQSGSVFLNGSSIGRLNQKDIARVIGYVQQNQYTAFPYSVFQYILMGRACNVGLFRRPSKQDEKIVRSVIEMIGISEIVDSPVSEISGGERQQAAIARAMAQKPQVIFFDEPTSHLDYGNQINTLRLIASLREKGISVVMTTHNPDHCMMLGGKAAILYKDGTLETGRCEEIVTEARLKEVYKTDLRLTYVDAVDRIACIPRGL